MLLLGTPYLLYFGVPLITVCLSVFIKYVSRNDKHSGFKKEDTAVGLDLAVTALLIFITESTQLARSLPVNNPPQNIINKLSSVPWILMAYLVGIWGVSTLIRKRGWEEDNKLEMIYGIIIPNFFGIVTLLFVVNWIE